MLLLIRTRAKKTLPVTRRSNPVTGLKKISSFASRFFAGLIGLAFSIGHLTEGDKGHNLLLTVARHLTTVLETIALIGVTLGFLFVRNREER